MSYRCVTAIGVLATVVSVASVRPAHSSEQDERVSRNGARPATVKAWSPPRTPWGEADLQGPWTNTGEFWTPFEKPAEYEGKTEQELRQLLQAELKQEATPEERAARVEFADDPGDSGTGNGPVWWYEHLDTRASRLWSLVDPPDGQMPPLTPEAVARAVARAERMRRTRMADPDGSGYLPTGPEDLTLQDRCMSGIRLYHPNYYNNLYRVFQSPGYVVILHEMFHDARIIPTDGRSHGSDDIRQLSGHSRDRWEGDTLVIETTGFSDKSALSPTGGPAFAFAAGDWNPTTLRVTERLTRTAPDTLDYRFTVEDPKTWIRPWTVVIPWTKDRPGNTLFEYACHEANYSLPHILSGARAVEKRLASEEATQR